MRKQRGHFCWCCGRIRANEKFTGRGHARHLCRDCSMLGKDELAYRQAALDIERLIDWRIGVVPRKHRKRFESFLLHPVERVRRHAERVAAEAARVHEDYRRLQLAYSDEDLVLEPREEARGEIAPGMLEEFDLGEADVSVSPAFRPGSEG